MSTCHSNELIYTTIRFQTDRQVHLHWQSSPLPLWCLCLHVSGSVLLSRWINFLGSNLELILCCSLHAQEGREHADPKHVTCCYLSPQSSGFIPHKPLTEPRLWLSWTVALFVFHFGQNTFGPFRVGISFFNLTVLSYVLECTNNVLIYFNLLQFSLQWIKHSKASDKLQNCTTLYRLPFCFSQLRMTGRSYEIIYSPMQTKEMKQRFQCCM